MYRSTFSWPRHRWIWVVSFTALALYHWEKCLRYPLDRAPKPVWTIWTEIYFTPAGNRFRAVTIPTELSPITTAAEYRFVTVHVTIHLQRADWPLSTASVSWEHATTVTSLCHNKQSLSRGQTISSRLYLSTSFFIIVIRDYVLGIVLSRGHYVSDLVSASVG
jgi:hypothetical protein